MLIGLAAKNSILIVEFAEQLRGQGRSIVDAAVEAARIRLRPILMTSFAFILGVLPLAYATGAGAGARNSVGTAVAGGMLASTFLSIFFIPVLYVIIRTIAPGKVRHAQWRLQEARMFRSLTGRCVSTGPPQAWPALLAVCVLLRRHRHPRKRLLPMEAVTLEQAVERASRTIRRSRRRRRESCAPRGCCSRRARRRCRSSPRTSARLVEQHRAPVRRRDYAARERRRRSRRSWACRCSRRRDGRRPRRRAIRSRSPICRPPTCAPRSRWRRRRRISRSSRRSGRSK